MNKYFEKIVFKYFIFKYSNIYIYIYIFFNKWRLDNFVYIIKYKLREYDNRIKWIIILKSPYASWCPLVFAQRNVNLINGTESSLGNRF